MKVESEERKCWLSELVNGIKKARRLLCYPSDATQVVFNAISVVARHIASGRNVCLFVVCVGRTAPSNFRSQARCVISR